MAKKSKAPAGKWVETHRHDEAKRRNIPTAEYPSVIQRKPSKRCAWPTGAATATSTPSSPGEASEGRERGAHHARAEQVNAFREPWRERDR
jgi:hypothetical protein